MRNVDDVDIDVDLFTKSLLLVEYYWANTNTYIPDESKGRPMSFDVHLSVRGVQWSTP